MNQDQNFIIFSDVKRLFFKSKWIIVLGAIAFGAFGFYVRTQKPIVYEVKAVFKEAGKSNMNLSGGAFDSFLSAFSAGAAKQGHVILQSSVILEPVIEKLGLQAEVAVEGAFERRKRHFFDALTAERGRSIEKQEGFEFLDVSYHGERPKNLALFFTSHEIFEVRDPNHHVLSTGIIGKKAEVEDISFTLSKTPKDLKLRWSYPLSISPLFEKVLALGVIFEAKPTLGDASILSLEIEHSDRNFGIRVLNEVMETYKNYLKEESSQIAKEQLSFLTERRDGYMREMEDLLEDHVVYLKEHLNRTGTLNLKEQLSSLENRKGKLLTDLLNIDLSVEDLLETTPSLASHLGPEVDALQRELHTIAKEKDALSLANAGHPRFQFDMAKHLDRLDQIEKEELKVKTGIDTFFSALSDTIRQKDQIAFDIGEFTAVLSPDAARLKKVQNQKHNLKELIVEASSKGLSSAYLKSQMRLLSLQEKGLKGRLFQGVSRRDEYRGIDLTTARSLLLSYLKDLDKVRSTIREITFAKEQIKKDEAEWGSLAAIFPDPICQEMVRDIGKIKQTLRNERNVTERESERFEKKLSLMEDDLSRHISQTLEILKLEVERNEDKIGDLRVATLDLLGQEVALIETQIEDRIEERLSSLQKERALVDTQLVSIKKEMEGVPDSWLREHRIQYSADMNRGMLEALVQLVESKSIEQNLSFLESKPLDFAKSSLKPKRPLLKVFGGVGALLGVLFAFIGCFIYYFY
ncbi:MAG: hypothetical protein HRU43_03835 [Simkaniaceae bacterium]|nr:hypothetical protein [Simkaniaceae bacterium]